MSSSISFLFPNLDRGEERGQERKYSVRLIFFKWNRLPCISKVTVSPNFGNLNSGIIVGPSWVKWWFRIQREQARPLRRKHRPAPGRCRGQRGRKPNHRLADCRCKRPRQHRRTCGWCIWLGRCRNRLRTLVCPSWVESVGRLAGIPVQ